MNIHALSETEIRTQYITPDIAKTWTNWVAQGCEESLPGQYRNKPVIITGSNHLPPAPSQVAQAVRQWLEEALPDWMSRYHPVQVAALAHLRLVTIHPFMDGNGRTARLLMNLFLMKAGYPVTLIPAVVRRDYIDCLERAHTQDDPQPFLDFVSQMVCESARDHIRLLKHTASL